MRCAMISGVTGQDGSYLAELLLEKGYKVVGLKRRTSMFNTTRIDHLYDNPNFHLEFFDLDDVGCIWRLLTDYYPDEIYNLACQSHVRVSFDIPESTVKGIFLGTLYFLNAMREVCPNAKFYQASSSEMYGDYEADSYNEETPMMPASPYACAKLAAHHLIRNYREAYNMFCCSGILFNHGSPRRGETFVTRKISLAAARIKLGLQDKLILRNLNAKRDWGYARDYVKAMWLMLQQREPDDFVIATGKTYSVKDFLEATFKYAGIEDYERYIGYSDKYYRPHEVPYLRGDASKAKRKLGWKPTVKFKDLVKLMYNSDYKLIKDTEG